MVEGATPSAVRGLAPSTAFGGPPPPFHGGRIGQKKVPDKDPAPILAYCRLKEKKDRQFCASVETAIRHGKVVRIGACWGSLDQELLTGLVDENARSRGGGRSARRDAVGDGAARRSSPPIGRRRSGLPETASSYRPRSRRVQDIIAVYRELAAALGLRAASRPERFRHGLEGHRRLLRRARHPAPGRHRHTIRVSLTPEPGGDRTLEVKVAQELPADHGLPDLHAAGRRLPGLRAHDFDGLPGARPGDTDAASQSAMREWKRTLSRRRGVQRCANGRNSLWGGPHMATNLPSIPS